tara:strand:- start:621 stop:1115 length:495 start_codon:yes stop_codon:yes gene_type:complete
MNKAYLSIGTNKGSRLKNIKSLIKMLLSDNIIIKNKSSIFKTEPLGFKKQNNFYNIVIEVQFDFECDTLFKNLKNIENTMGRDFYEPRNFPRIIDIDILTFNDSIITNNMYTIPHIALHKRKFVLVPWNEICPKYIVPKLNESIKMLLNNTKDSSIICKLNSKY